LSKTVNLVKKSIRNEEIFAAEIGLAGPQGPREGNEKELMLQVGL
jgi:hypothetical protein